MSTSVTSDVTTDPVLILIHGASLNFQMWIAVRRHLDPRFRVLAPDLPGHGSRRNEPFTLEGAIATISASAKSVAPAPVILVGDSLGGYTAMASAQAVPAWQLKGLVLGGCSANLMSIQLLPYLFKIATYRVLIALFGETSLIQSSVAKLLRKMAFPAEDVRTIIDAGVSLSVFSQVVHALRGINFRNKLAAIIQPVLMINGTRDTGMMKQEDSFLAVAQNGIRHHFKHCEHGVSLRRSAEFATLVNEFANRLRQS